MDNTEKMPAKEKNMVEETLIQMKKSNDLENVEGDSIINCIDCIRGLPDVSKCAWLFTIATGIMALLGAKESLIWPIVTAVALNTIVIIDSEKEKNKKYVEGGKSSYDSWCKGIDEAFDLKLVPTEGLVDMSIYTESSTETTSNNLPSTTVQRGIDDSSEPNK